MHIYLIRHGETIHNQSKIHQYTHTPLSERGEQQALQLAQRLKSAKIDRIYASPMTRAQHTAQIIAEQSQLEFITLENLHEVKNPSVFWGKSHTDPELEPIKELIQQHRDEPKWHHSDEENFFDLRDRVQRVMTLMEQETEEDILLVTHGNFIAMFTSIVLLQGDLTPRVYADLKYRMSFSNTGITHFQFSPSAPSPWKIVTLNDTTHLS